MPTATQPLEFPTFLSDNELADILITTTDWVRSHASEIPGCVEQWLGGLERLFVAEQVAVLTKVPESWVYANADEIPGLLRLGRYVRFRPTAIHQFLSGAEFVL